MAELIIANIWNEKITMRNQKPAILNGRRKDGTLNFWNRILSI
jgi:hypothetical protein